MGVALEPHTHLRHTPLVPARMNTKALAGRVISSVGRAADS
jgi:hypothetical protein